MPNNLFDILKWSRGDEKSPPSVLPSVLIVLSYPRSGSSWWRNLLGSHPQVMMFGEVFSKHNIATSALANGDEAYHILPHPVLRFHRDHNPVEYYHNLAAFPFAGDIRYVGLKLFPGHCERPGLMQAILQDSRVSFIHLKRRNLLKQALSLYIAQRTGVWTGVDTSTQEVTLDRLWLLQHFQRLEREMEYFDSLAAAKPSLTFWYEDLEHSPGKALRQTLKFLNLPLAPLKPDRTKQNHGRLENQIANLHELKKTFAGSPYEKFFPVASPTGSIDAAAR